MHFTSNSDFHRTRMFDDWIVQNIDWDIIIIMILLQNGYVGKCKLISLLCYTVLCYTANSAVKMYFSLGFCNITVHVGVKSGLMPNLRRKYVYIKYIHQLRHIFPMYFYGRNVLCKVIILNSQGGQPIVVPQHSVCILPKY